MKLMSETKKIILVTGGTSGIGKETVRGLAALGHTVIFTARDKNKGQETKKEIVDDTKNEQVDFLICDLSSFASIRKFADEFKTRHEKLNVLINNAGVLPHDRAESKDGIELNLAVNFLAPFLLSNLLLPLLKAGSPSRIVNVSSTVHTEGRIYFDDLESKKSFDRYHAYGQSKLALILWTKKMANELKEDKITINCLHPGVIGTEMTMQYVREMNPLAAFLFRMTFVTAKKGAETSIYLAISDEVSMISGEYFVKKKAVKSSPESYDMVVAEKLCSLAEEYVKKS